MRAHDRLLLMLHEVGSVTNRKEFAEKVLLPVEEANKIISRVAKLEVRRSLARLSATHARVLAGPWLGAEGGARPDLRRQLPDGGDELRAVVGRQEEVRSHRVCARRR